MLVVRMLFFPTPIFLFKNNRRLKVSRSENFLNSFSRCFWPNINTYEAFKQIRFP